MSLRRLRSTFKEVRAADGWQLAAGVWFLLYLGVIVLTFRHYGITSDEHHHVKYGADVARWYASFFQDHSVFQTRNTWLYGGAFDLFAHFAGAILPLDRYDANHLCNALTGLVGVWAAYRIGLLMGGPCGGFLAAACLTLTPRYFGHAFNNPKDIPFAAGYLWSVFFLLQGLRAYPNLGRSWAVKTGLAIGLTLGVRIGGALLIAYLVPFFLIWHFLVRQLGSRPRDGPKARALLPVAAAAAVSYGVMLVFWPYAQIHPLSGPWEAVQTFSRFAEGHTSLFDGRYVLNTEAPRTYALTWLSLTLPGFAFAGLGAWGLLAPRRTKPIHILQNVLLLCSAAVPIGYAVGSHMPLYDGIRHLVFAIAPLSVMGALGWADLWDRFHPWRLWVGIVGIALLGVTLTDMIRTHPNQYVYFNRVFAGGVVGAAGRFDTDYWHNSFKAGVRWIEAHPEWQAKQGKTRLGAFYAPLSEMVDAARYDCDVDPEVADLYLATTRHDRHRAIPGRIVHTIQASSVPMLYIVSPDSTRADDPFFADSPAYHFRRGEILRGTGRYEEALASYLTVVALMDRGVTAGIAPGRIYLRVGNAYQDMERFSTAMTYYHRVLEVQPLDPVPYNNIGVIYTHLGEHERAIEWLQSAIDIRPGYLEAFKNIAEAAKAAGNEERAERAYQDALKVDPGASDVQARLGRLYYSGRRFGEAIEQFSQVVGRYPDDSAGYFNLGLALTGQGDYEKSIGCFEKAIALGPDDFESHYRLGALYIHTHRFEDARAAYEQAAVLEPLDADVRSDLGSALVGTGRFEEAREAFMHALEIDNNHEKSRRRLAEISKMLK